MDHLPPDFVTLCRQQRADKRVVPMMRAIPKEQIIHCPSCNEETSHYASWYTTMAILSGDAGFAWWCKRCDNLSKKEIRIIS